MYIQITARYILIYKLKYIMVLVSTNDIHYIHKNILQVTKNELHMLSKINMEYLNLQKYPSFGFNLGCLKLVN